MLVLLIVLASMTTVALASPRFGVDSRPGFCDRNRRTDRRFDPRDPRISGRVSSPTPHRFH